MKLILAKWRLLWNLCPQCNSDAPEIDHCPVCNNYRDWPPSKAMKEFWLRRFKIINKL